MVDGAMTELLRPALYGARHAVVAAAQPGEGAQLREWEVAGPVCEAADTLATRVQLPARLGTGDLLAVMDTGAYGSVMASNYNLRPRVWEILVDGDTATVIATRESLDSMLHRFKF